MNDAKPTPGPWTNNEHSTFVWSTAGNVCACGDPRVSNIVGYTECDIGTPALSEAVANARLIATAPDMLAELKRLYEGTGAQLTADIIARAEGLR